MVDYWELSQPEYNREEYSALLFRNQIIPIIQRLSSTIQVKIDAFRKFFYGLITTLIVLEFPPENTL